MNANQEKTVIVLLDNVRSALNVGAIIRTCDGAGIKHIIISGITPFPPHSKVLKTSLGAEENITFEKSDNILQTLTEYKAKGFKIIAIEEAKTASNFFEYQLPEKIIYIFGNEITGVSEELMNLSDSTLLLPMKGVKNSLNVATTVGVILYNTMFSRND